MLSSPAQTPNPAPAYAPYPAPARDSHAEFRAAPLPWYGLDAGWHGKRRLGALCTDLDGTVQYGTLQHGEAATGRPGADPQRRAVTVVTMAALPRRPSLRPDGTVRGYVEASTVAGVAAVAGIGLVDDQWPWHLDVAVRQDWIDQQRELAAQIADRLGDMPWRLLTLSVDLQPQVFHYRESEYGWALATATQQCFLAAYGRGVSAYSLAFTRANLDDYEA